MKQETGTQTAEKKLEKNTKLRVQNIRKFNNNSEYIVMLSTNKRRTWTTWEPVFKCV